MAFFAVVFLIANVGCAAWMAQAGETYTAMFNAFVAGWIAATLAWRNI